MENSKNVGFQLDIYFSTNSLTECDFNSYSIFTFLLKWKQKDLFAECKRAWRLMHVYFNDTVSSLVYLMTNARMINLIVYWKVCGRRG
jgi:hypothetical protein